MRNSPGLLPPPVRLKWAWPAYVSAANQLVYACEKFFYASQGRLGLPGGPPVPASEYAETSNVALTQSTLGSLGLLSALIALATVRPTGTLLPRPLLLLGVWGALIPAAAGGFYVLSGASTTGWSARAAVQGIASLAVWLTMAWFYTRRYGRPR